MPGKKKGGKRDGQGIFTLSSPYSIYVIATAAAATKAVVATADNAGWNEGGEGNGNVHMEF